MYSEGNNCQREVYARQEQPQKEIFIDAFWIDRTEVTNAQFCLFFNEKGNKSENGIQWFEPGYGHRGVVYGYIEEINGEYIPLPGYENYPVVEVSWYDPSWHVRCSYRKVLSPSSARMHWVGFRCVTPGKNQ